MGYPFVGPVRSIVGGRPASKFSQAEDVLFGLLQIPSQVSLDLLAVDPVWDAFRARGHLDALRDCPAPRDGSRFADAWTAA